MSLSCEQFLATMSNLLDGGLDSAQNAAAQEHVQACARCRVVLATTRETLRLVGDARYFEMPEGARQRLHQALEQGLDEPLVPAQLRPAAVAPAPQRPRRSLLGFGSVSGRLRATAWAAAVVVVLLGASVARWRAGATTTSGWLIDQHCFAAFQNRIADHPRSCLLRCAASTYGLVDAKGHFTPFDANGNRSALAAVKASNKPDHLWVTVRAKRSSSEVLEVQDLELTEPAEGTTAVPYSR